MCELLLVRSDLDSILVIRYVSLWDLPIFNACYRSVCLLILFPFYVECHTYASNAPQKSV